MRFTEVVPRRFTLNKVHAPARSVDLITVAIFEVFPPAGDPALAVASMVVGVFMAAVAVDVTGDGHEPASRTCKNFNNGEEYHAAQNFDSISI